MSRFTLPRDVYYGAGSLAELKSLKGEKAIIDRGGQCGRNKKIQGVPRQR